MGRPSTIGWKWDDERTRALAELILAGNSAADSAKVLGDRFACPRLKKDTIIKAVRGKEGRARLVRLLPPDRYDELQEKFGLNASARGGMKLKKRPIMTPTSEQHCSVESQAAVTRAREERARRAELERQLKLKRIKEELASKPTRPRVFLCRLPAANSMHICGAKSDKPFCDEHLAEGLRWHAEVFLERRQNPICEAPT
jgi:hypothetical protein